MSTTFNDTEIRQICINTSNGGKNFYKKQVGDQKKKEKKRNMINDEMVKAQTRLNSSNLYKSIE